MKTGLGIICRKNESIDSLLSRFKKLMKENDVFLEMKKHEHYEKKSDEKKRKKRRRKFSDGTIIKNNTL